VAAAVEGSTRHPVADAVLAAAQQRGQRGRCLLLEAVGLTAVQCFAECRRRPCLQSRCLTYYRANAQPSSSNTFVMCDRAANVPGRTMTVATNLTCRILCRP
jgi:hypothetical protein